MFIFLGESSQLKQNETINTEKKTMFDETPLMLQHGIQRNQTYKLTELTLGKINNTFQSHGSISQKDIYHYYLHLIKNKLK